jgi:hypothetical protein
MPLLTQIASTGMPFGTPEEGGVKVFTFDNEPILEDASDTLTFA